MNELFLGIGVVAIVAVIAWSFTVGFMNRKRNK